MLAAGTADPGTAHGASIVLWIIAGLVVALGMARLPLVPDRLWRFLCWSGAIVLALYAAARIKAIPSGWIWVTWAVLGIVVLGLLFWVERLRDLEHRETETTKESSASGSSIWTAPSTRGASQALPSRAPIFDAAPPELAGMTGASIQEMSAGRTDLQKAKLVEEHIGKQVRVSGKVEGVESATLRQGRIRSSSGFPFYLFFDDPNYDAESLLLVLNLGDEIAVSGQIFRIGTTSISLDRCRQVEVRGRAS